MDYEPPSENLEVVCQPLETLEAFETNTGGLTGIKAYDLNNDKKLEIVLTDFYTLG